ncbi:MAG: poly-gamma-glutamate synthase PgsB [Candidatus Eisenbacteria bacterium]
MKTFLLLLGFVLAYWILEALRLRRALRHIPIRIHVNGSRGKSSVTRLIAAGLRESGVRTVAKTTGTKARFIHADGSEDPIIRLGSPNICEQVGVLDRARKEGAEAIVLECMAIRPDLQKTTEERILHSTIGVITNVRPDHLDVMGPTVKDAAVALSTTLPRDGVAFVGQTDHLDVLQDAARRRRTRLSTARNEIVPPRAMEGFAYLEHEENVALALEVTRTLGVDDEVALRGMHRVTPDPGACTRWRISVNDRVVEFFNIFAANDLESTVTIWNRIGLGQRPDCPSIALLNLRGDRIDRSLQFAEAVEKDLFADYYVLVGDLSRTVVRRFENKVPAGRLLTPGRVSASAILSQVSQFRGVDGPLAELRAHGAEAEGGRPVDMRDRVHVRVGGIGNIGGIGHEIVGHISNAGVLVC